MGARKHRGPTRSKARAALVGTIKVSARGTGTVETPEGTFHIPARRVGEALHGDTVTLRLLGAYHGNLPEATVTGITARGLTTFAACYRCEGQLRVLVPLDERILHDFTFDEADRTPEKLGVKDGQIVVARVVRYPNRRAMGLATVERLIGDAEQQAVPIEAIIAAHDLAVEFPQEALDEARACTLDVEAALAEPARRDIRDRFVATVDPTDARDFDDALSVEKTPEGGWVLGVHIADVSAYVSWGSALDLAARDRATSTYLADRVIPMLPEELSNNLCSLVPNEDRLAMTVDLALDARGAVTGATMYPSVIRSKARLTYDEVDAILNGSAPDRAVAGVDLGGFFSQLDRIRQLRGKIRRARGSIGFVSAEAKVALDEEGRPTGVKVRVPTPATELVEEAMLAANEAVAARIAARGIPGVFRVHEQPDHQSLADLVPLLTELGCLAPQAKAKLVSGNPHAVQAVLDEVAGSPEEELVSSLLLRSMKRATYEPENAGHYGLGAESYCHFTSPIRRYPDLMMHRALKGQITKTLKGAYRDQIVEALPTICQHSSKAERNAAAAALESQAVKLAAYMENFIGQVFEGVITGVAPFGLFVRISLTHAEGLLHVSDLPGGWWEFDEARRELACDETGGRYRLGQTVEVRVRACDPMRGRIDLALPARDDEDEEDGEFVDVVW